MVMMVFRITLLLLGMLLAAHCDVRARDPEVEEDEEQLKDFADPDDWEHGTLPEGLQATPHRGGSNRDLPDAHGAQSLRPDSSGPSEETPGASAEAGGQTSPARTGNWCAFVEQRVVTMAVSCGTEKYTIKSQSPCPNGTPDCQLVMYKLSTRPVYREKQKVFTALLWRCCPGHGGKNCEETVADGHISGPTMEGRPHPGEPEAHHTGSTGQAHLSRIQNREQNDFQIAASLLTVNNTAIEMSLKPVPQSAPQAKPVHHHHQQQSSGSHERGTEDPPPLPDPSGLLPHITALLMSQLQPVLDGFNHTLEQLSLDVKDLQRDMAQLRRGQVEETQALEDGAEHEGLRDRMEETAQMLYENFQQLAEMRDKLDSQQEELDERLHAQHAMLHYNLTHFKTDMDMKIKRNQKMLQVNFHALNTSLLEVKQEQEGLIAELQRGGPPDRRVPSFAQPQGSSAIWEAIARLDVKVVNNTVSLQTMAEDQDILLGDIQALQRVTIELERNISQTGRNSQILFMETGLEVEAAKVDVLNSITKMESNLTSLHKYVHDMESDVNYIFTKFYKNLSFATLSCDCGTLKTSVAQLEKAVANVTELANENRLAIDGEADLRIDNWGDGSWGPSVEDLKEGLLHVKNSLAFEQEKSRALLVNVSQLQATLLGINKEIDALQEQDKLTAKEMRHLASSFHSLLKDAVRHTEVLEILLAEEVLEFMDQSPEKHMVYSIPALRKSIQDIQEQIKNHSPSLAAMLSTDPSDGIAADEPSVLTDWVSVDLRKRHRDQMLEHRPEIHSEYLDSTFWTLEKKVEALGVQVSRLEKHQCPSCCDCTKDTGSGGTEGKLQKEVAVLHKALEDHLRTFDSVFSNTEGLAKSQASLDLDKLSALINKKRAKQQRRGQKKRQSFAGQQVNQRSKRDASLETAVHQRSGNPHMFLASCKNGANGTGLVVFDSMSINHGELYSPKTGRFRAPVAGVYLFVLTLDFGPPPSLAYLRRGEEAVAASLYQRQRLPTGPATRVCLLQLEQGEQLHLELVQGTLKYNNPQDNTFSGLLLHQIT